MDGQRTTATRQEMFQALLRDLLLWSPTGLMKDEALRSLYQRAEALLGTPINGRGMDLELQRQALVEAVEAAMDRGRGP